jgi:hypothetical protein
VFDNQTTARNMIFVALDTIPGLKQKRIEYIRLVDKSNSSERQADEHERLVHVRSALSNLLFEHVLLNGEGSGSRFLDNTGMQALVGSKRSFLGRTDSFGAVVRFALPGLIHESSPGCIRPHQIEHFHLNDPEYCQRVFRHELSLVMPSQLNAYLEAYTKSGDTSARPGTAQDKQIAIQNLASEIRKQILQRGASGGEHWLTEKKMLSLISSKKLGLKTSSFGGLLERFLPGLVDEKNIHALQPHECHHGFWKNEQYARTQILRAFILHEPKLEAVHNFLAAVKRGEISNEIRQAAYKEVMGLKFRTFIQDSGLQSLYLRPIKEISQGNVMKLRDMAKFCFLEQPSNRKKANG